MFRTEASNHPGTNDSVAQDFTYEVRAIAYWCARNGIRGESREALVTHLSRLLRASAGQAADDMREQWAKEHLDNA